MSLKNLALSDAYRSDRNNLVADFYAPCLAEAESYDRAVGYFTSHSLALAGQGLARLVEREGKIRIIASPHLNEDDTQDIEKGYALREVVEQSLVRELDSGATTQWERDQLGILGRLIADGRLDIKIAFLVNDRRLGLYHEKIGIFCDPDGNRVAFVGSSNETGNALLLNFESFEVYRSWVQGEEARVMRLQRDFNDLWEDRTENLQIFEFPDVASDMLVRCASPEVALNARSEPDEEVPPLLPSPSPGGYGQPEHPANLEVRPYQEEAIANWFSAGGGILRMATGTGKTITALSAMTRTASALRSRSMPLVVMVLCPYQHLVDQWSSEAAAFGVQPLQCLGSYRDWFSELESALSAVRGGSLPFLMVVATNDTFRRRPFQTLLGNLDSPLLLIADEMHNLGAAGIREHFPENANYRLGLSATPERWFDDEGTEALSSYFGPVVFELGLADAIAQGALCPYRYHPVPVALSADEQDRYDFLSAEIARLTAGMGRDADVDRLEGPVKLKMLERARLLGHAAGKVPALRREMSARSDDWFQLVYCAEGNPPVVSEHQSLEGRQIDQVLRVVGRDLGLSANTYTSETSRSDRRRLLERFGSGGDLRVLISMRCLDEGVDIPDARIAYLLASSTNPRQFIQRRGRILRRAPGKTHADIVDFVAVPAASGSGSLPAVENQLLERELARVKEFAALAQNEAQAMQSLLEIRRRHNLLVI